jgi:hypothetical protein
VLLFRVRCGSKGAVRLSGCGVAHRVRCGSKGAVCLRGFGVAHRLRCGSDSSASACCTAGPSSNLGSAPLEEALYRADAMRTTRVALYINIVCLLD